MYIDNNVLSEGVFCTEADGEGKYFEFMFEQTNHVDRSKVIKGEGGDMDYELVMNTFRLDKHKAIALIKELQNFVGVDDDI